MKIQVKTASGAIESIELPQGEWRALLLGEIHCLIGAGVSHRFTDEGLFIGSYPVPLFLGRATGRAGDRKRLDPAHA